jgi:hypothetical protein
MKLNFESKLSLNKRTLSSLSDDQLSKIKGGDGFESPIDDIEDGESGFLSIGHECSCNNTCARLTRRNECFCCCP